ncbi:KGGVGR-motif variant AAA ATPase [Pseudomonas citronellolis]|uniref:KGGVGR-motif variant AAA ATPase n=1 Tax=Pseudomonas citronellolis TaxID=53408 RepID=UPI0021C04359|nr:hypothetical protein [Pseudomonas citronellolis]UXJ53072.1 hypothetical protein N5P21_02320 [Pseudomonas citronellolis]
MAKPSESGNIITFYSYKGGVGRTMAIANVAFLAALNKLRVLVMDWDLEAPGLAYYFRGLLEASDAKSLKDTPGVLDMLWEWSGTVRSIENDSELEHSLEYLQSGEIFNSGVFPLLGKNYFDEGLILDYIGAGRKIIHTPSPVAYEDALAQFSWSDFFDAEAGGLFFENLRNWAKSKYDVVIIDSRTGLADVAGICTMQIPDTVALCFVLNRQNIDGVAKVSAAIRTKRQEEISIRAVPMRVARRDTSEESDARARAISELTRIGGFSSIAVQEDMKLLQVAADENVPFYETLAPFHAPDPSLDPLSLNYIRLASSVLGRELYFPPLEPEFVDLVRRRLQPRHATVEYLSKLKGSEPERAVTELQHLLESAYEAELEGTELEDDYVLALIHAADEIGDMAGNTVESMGLRSKGLDLLRILSESGSEKWKYILISELESYIDNYMFFWGSGDEELTLLEELDGLLAEIPTIAMKLKRISYRRRVARFLVDEKDTGLAIQVIGEISALIKDLQKLSANMAADQLEQVLESETDVFILKGDIESLKGARSSAYNEFRQGLNKIVGFDFQSRKEEASRLHYELHSRLAQGDSNLIDAKDAAIHALQAASWGRGTYSLMFNFIPLGKAILRYPDNPDFALAFCGDIFDLSESRSRLHLANFHGRQTSSVVEFLSVVNELASLFYQASDDRPRRGVLVGLTEAVGQVLKNLERRKRTISERDWESIGQQVKRIKAIANDFDIDTSKTLLVSDHRTSSRTATTARSNPRRSEERDL